MSIPLVEGAGIAADWIRTRLGRIVLGLLLFVGSLAATVVSTLSYTGYCFDQRRYFSDDEFVAASIDNLIRQRRHTLVTSTPTETRFTPVWVNMYADRTEFLDLNPHCCRVVPHNELGDWRHATFGERLFGQAAKVVEVNYAVRYSDSVGEARSSQTTSHSILTNCGSILENAR